jgi:hypothetical protein
MSCATIVEVEDVILTCFIATISFPALGAIHHPEWRYRCASAGCAVTGWMSLLLRIVIHFI